MYKESLFPRSVEEIVSSLWCEYLPMFVEKGLSDYTKVPPPEVILILKLVDAVVKERINDAVDPSMSTPPRTPRNTTHKRKVRV